MPVRKKLREFRKSFSSRLDALLPSQTDVQSAGLLPRARASDSALGPSTHQADLRTERKPQDAFQGDITNRKLQIPTSPPALLVTQPTGEVASVSQQPSTSDLGHLGGQPAIPHAPVVAFNVDTIASTGPGQSTSTSSWVNLKTFSRVLDQNKGVFGPLRGVIAELVGCIEIYEVVHIFSYSSQTLVIINSFVECGEWSRRIQDATKRARRFIRGSTTAHFPRHTPNDYCKY